MGFLTRHRFKLLLLMLIVVILISPPILDSVAQAAPGIVRNIVFGFTLSLLLVSLLMVRDERRAKGLFIALFIASLLIDTAAAFLWPKAIGYWDHAIRIMFLGFVLVGLLRHLFQPKHVNFDTLCASLCVYFLIGLIWMNLYVILETIVPGSIVPVSEADLMRSEAAREMERSINMLYFSFTTLTSVGYGDIVPRTNVARMLSITEALVGQSYLLIMVSRLVGLHVAQAFPGSPAAAPEEARDASAGEGKKSP